MASFKLPPEGERVYGGCVDQTVLERHTSAYSGKWEVRNKQYHHNMREEKKEITMILGIDP